MALIIRQKEFCKEQWLR